MRGTGSGLSPLATCVAGHGIDKRHQTRRSRILYSKEADRGDESLHGSMDMNLEKLLSIKKNAILERWFHLIVDTYPSDTSRFLKKEKDRFANPVGNTISEGIDALYEGLFKGADSVKVSPFLDRIIRVRAIQDFSPSEAIGFVLSLKKAIREELKDEIRDDRIINELLLFESEIDELLLLSFDIYMKCREKVYELKATEVKNRTFRLLERANLISPIPEQEEGSEGGNDNGST